MPQCPRDVSFQICTLVPKSPQAMGKSFPGFAHRFPGLLITTVEEIWRRGRTRGGRSAWKATVSYQGWKGQDCHKPVVPWLPVHTSGPESLYASSSSCSLRFLLWSSLNQLWRSRGSCRFLLSQYVTQSSAAFEGEADILVQCHW